MKNSKLRILILIMLAVVVTECMVLNYIKNKVVQVAGSQKTMTAATVLDIGGRMSALAHDCGPDYVASSHIYSHRGVEGEIEHSFEAYDSAIEAGSRYIEQDIVMSKDGTVYVSHDPNAVYMTGVSKLYADMTDEEIDELRTYKGKEILKLSDVFDRYGRSVNYVIELKVDDERLISGFEELIDRYGYEDIVTAQCESLAPLSSLKQKYPEMPMLYVCRTKRQIAEGMAEPYVDIIGVRANYMSAGRCDAVHNAGKKFCVWTLNTREGIETAIEIGADSYFTNDTALAMETEKSNYAVRLKRHSG